jgi:peptide/nickel transport system ATP-binding protein
VYEPLTGGRGRSEVPGLIDAGAGHLVRCHLPVAERQRIWAEEIKPKLEAGA